MRSRGGRDECLVKISIEEDSTIGQANGKIRQVERECQSCYWMRAISVLDF